MKRIIAGTAVALALATGFSAEANAADRINACSSNFRGAISVEARCSPGTIWVRAVARCLFRGPTQPQPMTKYGLWVRGSGAISTAKCDKGLERTGHTYQTSRTRG